MAKLIIEGVCVQHDTIENVIASARLLAKKEYYNYQIVTED